MWLVRIALLRPYTFIVLALIATLIGLLSIIKTPTDIFPAINIPVISVVWTYNGMPPDDMANRITSIFERAVTSTVTNIEHIESESLNGINVIKLFFQPDVNIAVALSEVTAISQTLLKLLPPGITPPQILNYDASTVPVMQLMLSSDTLPEQKLNDLANNFIRTQLATVQGAALPFAYGGKVRQIQVDLNTQTMQAFGLSAQSIATAVNNQSLILPAGAQKIGAYQYVIKLNSSPQTIDEFNQLPVKTTPNNVLYLRDVAHVRDGFAPQTNIVRMNGLPAVMMSVEKTGHASTLAILKRIKTLLPRLKDMLPSTLKLNIIGDQSLFVTAAIQGVLIEALTAAILTGIMILVFLGSLRSTLIITLSIPLSMLTSLSMLSFLGETINIMTLGGLALAVGILVDDATVTLENINWNLEQGKDIHTAIIEGAEQIAIPAFVSTLCICIVFIPMFFLTGVTKYLFVPMAEAVMFAMITSYLLSRTLVPTLAAYWLKPLHTQSLDTPFSRFHQRFETCFLRFRQRYQTALIAVLAQPKRFMGWFLLAVVGSVLMLWPWIGSDFFPNVDAGQIKLHLSAPSGTRVEETARLCGQIDALIHRLIPEQELNNIVDNIGLPISGVNLTYNNSATNGPQDADILITLNAKHRPTATYVHTLRRWLKETFPSVTFSFLPADIVNQILNFGLPSVIDLQIIGLKEKQNRHYAHQLLEHLRQIPGIVDARIRQADNYPALFVKTDRSRAKELGFTQRDIAASLLISLSGSFQTNPNFWVDPQNSVSYFISTQTPEYAMNSLQTLRNTPITNMADNTAPQLLSAMSEIQRIQIPAVISHYNVQPVIDLFAAIEGRDLGAVTHDLRHVLQRMKHQLPKGSQILLHGQIETQSTSFFFLYLGLLFSVVFIYLIMVINFQSWLDPLIIITALPAALAGIAWMLFLTHTDLSVPALTGALMCMGVATANSILVVSFARDHLKAHNDAIQAALAAGITRLRPVLMTALAMVLGMLPMALGLGEGGEQNAPLGRAVIGGLSFATVATLFFVPALFATLHLHKRNQGSAHAVLMAP